MSPVIQITAGHAVRYSNDNGVTMTEYEDQEWYEVRPHVARGMVARGWAKLKSPPAVAQPHQPAAPEPAAKHESDDDKHKKRR